MRLDSDNYGNSFKNITWAIEETDTLIKMIDPDGKIEIRFTRIQDNRFEYESPEFELILLEKPLGYDGSKPYELKYTIETKGLSFYKQLPLTQDEINNGDTRPDWAVNSYAVYHSSKKNNKYKTGKVFHLANTQVDGVWNDININVQHKLVTFTINADLDGASYPVRHVTGLTFGYTSEGASLVNNENYVAIQTGTPASSGDVVSFHAYLAVTTDAHLNRMALYDNDGGGDVGVIRAGSEEIDVPTGTAWVTFNISGTYSVTGTTAYYILLWSESTTGNSSIAYDSGASDASYNGRTYVSGDGVTGWQSPFTGENSGTEIYSLYITYTAGGGGADLTKWNGQSISGLTKWNGADIADLAKINGFTI